MSVNTAVPCRRVVVQDLFGGMPQVLDGRAGRNGECALEKALWDAWWDLREERERREALAKAIKQLNIFGEVEVARTLRNPWTEAREAEDERKGLTAR